MSKTPATAGVLLANVESRVKAFESIRAEVQSRGVPEMTMEEIDAEIAAARKERRERQAKELAMAGAR